MMAFELGTDNVERNDVVAIKIGTYNVQVVAQGIWREPCGQCTICIWTLSY
jgi:hypothetical protein